MNFTTITGSGSVTLGTPSDISNTTSNSVSGTTHTHALSGELVETTTGSPLYYGARAWVNFNGTGTVAIRASVNVSSITDNGTGRYTINFTTAMPDANYVTLGSAWGDTAGAAGPDMSTAPTTAAVKVFTTNPGNFYDTTGANFAIFR
jgi:hypothetical protein